jgi:hypothetical protein
MLVLIRLAIRLVARDGMSEENKADGASLIDSFTAQYEVVIVRLMKRKRGLGLSLIGKVSKCSQEGTCGPEVIY